MKSYKVELDLNNKQRTACLRHAGAARFAYNWGLARKIERYQAGEKVPSAIDLHKELNALKKTEFPWLYESSSCAPHEALRNLDVAFNNFFRRCKDGAKRKGYPKFKKVKRNIGSFALTGGIEVKDRMIRLPRIGELRLKQHGYLPIGVKIIAAILSQQAGHWFVSVRTNERPMRRLGNEALGVDVGIKTLAVLSDGTAFENPKALKTAERRLRRLHKSVSRKMKGSGNRKKAVKRLAIQYYRVSCIRKDAIHKATDAITKRASILGVETLNVVGMMKNHCLAKAIADASMSEFHRQLEYKMKWAGGTIMRAGMFYPSSKTCSSCGVVKENLTLGERTFKCDDCGNIIDRDLNAAVNLKNMAVSSTVTACGEDVRPKVIRPPDAASMKQEPNIAGILS